MADIYRSASGVVIWLGDTSVAVPREFGEEHVTEEVLINGLERAIGRTYPPWWERTWVIQEFVVARTSPKFCFGECVLPLEELHKLAHTANIRSRGQDRALALSLDNLRELGEAFQEGRLGLIEVAYWARNALATDPRDKVYSLLGFVTDLEKDLVQPDYSQSRDVVFANATFAMLKVARSLNLLSLSHRGNSDRSS